MLIILRLVHGLPEYKIVSVGRQTGCIFCNTDRLPIISRRRRRTPVDETDRGGPVKLDSMWQHRLTRLVRDRYMYSITYYRIIFKQNPFNIISRGVQR